MLGVGIKQVVTKGNVRIIKRDKLNGCKKSCFSNCWFYTRFLLATTTMAKELLPIADKPLIQYAGEEAIAAGIDILTFVTGRNKRAIEDLYARL